MSFGVAFALPARIQTLNAGASPFGQLGPTLDLVFAGIPTDPLNTLVGTLDLFFTRPLYEIAEAYSVWEIPVGMVAKTFSQIITFTRASSATYFDAAGVLQTATTDVPRFDYNPSTLAALGFLIEESRTNLLLQSGWAGAVGGSPGTAPTSWTIAFGTGADTTLVNSIYGTAEQAIKFDADATERIMYSQAVSVTNGVQYAASVYIEAVSGVIGDAMAVTNGTGTATQNTSVTSPSTPGRYTILFTATSTGTVNIRYGIGTTAGVAGTCSVTMSRPQVEAGAFPTSYIPTTTTAVTRAADVASVNTLSPWFNAAEGTLYAQGILVGGTATFFPSQVSFVGSNANNDSISIPWSAASSFMRFGVRAGGVAQADIAAGPTKSANSSFKVAGRYATNDVQAAFDGTLGTPDTTVTLPTITALSFGGPVSFQPVASVWLQRVTYYPRRLSNAELVSITS